MPASAAWGGIVLPLATPFRDDELDLDALQSNIGRWNAADVTGYLALGATGEADQLDESERLAVLRAAREATPANRLFLAGISAGSTRNTLRAIERAAELGVDGVVVLTPHYHKVMLAPAETQVRYFNAVSAASPLPVMIYDFPANTGIQLAADTVVRMAQHPQMVGIKDTSANIARLCAIVGQAPPHFRVIVGVAAAILPALSVGAAGAIVNIALLAPGLCVDLVRATTEARTTEARALAQRVTMLEQRIVARYSIPGLKLALDILGYRGGHCRQPIGRLDQAARDDIQAALRDAGVL
jgi:4-hydroxy-2-oxoglutarate aldolase